MSALPSIIPFPNDLAVLPGEWRLTNDSQVGFDAAFPPSKGIANSAAELLRPATGFALPVIPIRPPTGVYFHHSPDPALSGEYAISVDDAVVSISSSNRTGLFYGLQTLLQLLPPDVLKPEVSAVSWTIPKVSIRDFPRFRWRGIHLDVSRHFFPLPVVKSVIASMSRYKLNVFHFHLIDDQGWRIESKRFPLLSQIGSTRSSSPRKWHRNEPDGVPYGPFFYTQDDVRELIAFARDHEVEIVPEIEMPGHSSASLAAYPQYSCRGNAQETLTSWGISTRVFCLGNDGALAFLEELLDEMLTLFDSPFVHVGGDECPRDEWRNCPKCQARAQSVGVPLQSWFTSRIAHFLAARGRRLIGWDEILEGSLPAGATVMSWRGT
jgi:hexosaminidase